MGRGKIGSYVLVVIVGNSLRRPIDAFLKPAVRVLRVYLDHSVYGAAQLKEKTLIAPSAVIGESVWSSFAPPSRASACAVSVS